MIGKLGIYATDVRDILRFLRCATIANGRIQELHTNGLFPVSWQILGVEGEANSELATLLDEIEFRLDALESGSDSSRTGSGKGDSIAIAEQLKGTKLVTSDPESGRTFRTEIVLLDDFGRGDSENEVLDRFIAESDAILILAEIEKLSFAQPGTIGTRDFKIDRLIRRFSSWPANKLPRTLVAITGIEPGLAAILENRPANALGFVNRQSGEAQLQEFRELLRKSILSSNLYTLLQSLDESRRGRVVFTPISFPGLIDIPEILNFDVEMGLPYLAENKEGRPVWLSVMNNVQTTDMRIPKSGNWNPLWVAETLMSVLTTHTLPALMIGSEDIGLRTATA